jgi:nitroimidazol reductase NimA-like FMN-containing flavoprotein (pyridoxamine 5'-phosphate oxidase superfamily)
MALADNNIRSQIQELLNSQQLAVLSTHTHGQPYASLVAYAATEDLRHLFFATPVSTRKFTNIQADGRVALLIDSRANRDADFHRAAALTAVGTASPIEAALRDEALALYLARHPYLQDFVRSPTTGLLQVEMSSYFLVTQFQNVVELHIRP